MCLVFFATLLSEKNFSSLHVDFLSLTLKNRAAPENCLTGSFVEHQFRFVLCGLVSQPIKSDVISGKSQKRIGTEGALHRNAMYSHNKKPRSNQMIDLGFRFTKRRDHVIVISSKA